MEGFNITVINNSEEYLDFEDDKNTQISYNKIKSEFFKKIRKYFRYVMVVVMVIVIYFAIIYPIYLIPHDEAGITTLQPYTYNFSINWVLFSSGIFLIIYFIKSMLIRITPSFKQYISSEINNIGFKIHEKKNSRIVFLILNSVSVLLILLLELQVIKFNTNIFNSLFKGFLTIFLIFSLIIPILWRLSYDRFSVNVKKDYHIDIIPNYRIRKGKTKIFQPMGIYFTSNRIALKFNKNKERLYNHIAESRWLPKRRIALISRYNAKIFLRFNEFSTPSNFPKQFLNVVLALQEWDNQKRKGKGHQF